MWYKIQAYVCLSGCPKHISKLSFLFGYLNVFIYFLFHFNTTTLAETHRQEKAESEIHIFIFLFFLAGV